MLLLRRAIMIKTLAVLFGAVFVLIGILGFVPAVTPAGMLFGVFAVNPLHNMVHLITGVIALAVGLGNERNSTLFFQIFGILYTLVAVVGFAYGGAMMMGMAHNTADAGLHLLIGFVAMFVGFVLPHLPVQCHTPQWVERWHWPHGRH
jgi:hypothetical protein